MTRYFRTDWTLIALQIVIIVIAIGAPNLAGASRFFGTGSPTGSSVAALLGCVIWLVAAAMVMFVAWTDLRNHSRQTRSFAPVALAVVFGLVCLGVGVTRYQQVQYHGCCGSLPQTETLLTGAR